MGEELEVGEGGCSRVERFVGEGGVCEPMPLRMGGMPGRMILGKRESRAAMDLVVTGIDWSNFTRRGPRSDRGDSRAVVDP